MNLRNKKDLVLVFGLFLLLGIVFYYVKISYLLMGIFYFGIPSLYISIRHPKFIKKALIESLLYSIPVVTTLDYLATTNNAWRETTVFDIKVLGVIPLETYSWSFLFLFLVIMVYDSFFDKYSIKKISKNIKKELILGIVLLIGFGILLVFAPTFLIVSRFYVWVLVVLTLVLVVGLYRQPKLISRAILCSTYLFIPWMIHEIVALQTGQWFFDSISNYIGSISIGRFVFPIEEFAWWIIVVPLVIVLHEYFADNNR